MGVEIEVDIDSVFGAFGGFKHGALIKTEEASDDGSGEAADGDIVVFGDGVVFFAGEADAIFGAFELVIELEEGFGGFDFGVGFDGDEEAGEGRVEGVGGFDLARDVSAGFGLGPGAASFGDGGEGGLFEVGAALDGADEVGDEVEAALVLGFDGGPFFINRFV